MLGAARAGVIGLKQVERTFYPDVDGRVYSFNATYATARSGSGVTVDATSISSGQQLTGGFYYCTEGLISFDTAAIPDGATILSATLALYVVTDSSVTDYVVRARLFDFGATIDTGDYIAGASLSAQTLLASLSTASLVASARTALTSDAAFKNNINKTGKTRLILSSDRIEANTAPGGDEFQSYGNAAAVAAQRPLLTVVSSS